MSPQPFYSKPSLSEFKPFSEPPQQQQQAAEVGSVQIEQQHETVQPSALISKDLSPTPDTSQLSSNALSQPKLEDAPQISLKVEIIPKSSAVKLPSGQVENYNKSSPPSGQLENHNNVAYKPPPVPKEETKPNQSPAMKIKSRESR